MNLSNYLSLRPDLPARLPPPGRRRILRRGAWARSGRRPARSRTRICGPHFPPKAKSVIFLFMCGGVSHIDTFDPKDNKWAGKLIDAVGFGDNVARDEAAGDPLPAHVHAVREVRHSGLRLVPPRRRRDRRDRRGPVDVVQRGQPLPGRDRDLHRAPRPAVRSPDAGQLGLLCAGQRPTRICRRS